MSKPRTIKLFCPSLSKLVELVACDEQRLDLGSIAGGFGLDPSTVKINGHFISRGVDLVSNSVTWRSLLKFFSAKGLSTGKHDGDALVVDGKLTKVGTKRSYDCQPNHTPQNQNKKLRDSSSEVRGNRDDCLNENMKRPRENEVIKPTPCKRIR
ncbi:hypothetical protein Ddye_001255 [Dipteronia dyeriana]|uniref:Uncharacterized protein n=1 Tax=Dipteronia dyeriana TaxID=168575 RepID=A0AAE0CTB7_9ROSI|nr:hypothetical protein Ddye_001255 [Dipteronia dyeriana]